MLHPTSAVANPSMKNTDGGSLDDKQELEHGTDPEQLEQLNVEFNIVTMAKDASGTLIPSIGEYGSGEERNTYKTTTSGTYLSENWVPGDRPGWAKEHDIEKTSEYDYVRINVEVFNQGSHLDAKDYATNYRFSLQDPEDNATIINPTGTIKPGTKEVGLIIRLDDLATSEIELQTLGEIQMEAYVPSKSVIRFQDQNAWRSVNTGEQYSVNVNSKRIYDNVYKKSTSEFQEMLFSYTSLVGTPSGAVKGFIYARGALQSGGRSIPVTVAVAEVATNGQYQLPDTLDGLKAAESIRGQYYIEDESLNDGNHIVAGREQKIIVGYFNTSQL